MTHHKWLRGLVADHPSVRVLLDEGFGGVTVAQG